MVVPGKMTLHDFVLDDVTGDGAADLQPLEDTTYLRRSHRRRS